MPAAELTAWRARPERALRVCEDRGPRLEARVVDARVFWQAVSPARGRGIQRTIRRVYTFWVTIVVTPSVYVLSTETHYSYTPSYARAVRGRRGDDVHAERCRRVGRDQAALGGVLGVHVVDFTSFLPNRETDRPRLESTVRALARQRGVVVRSSPARDLATVLGRRPRPLGVRVAPSHPLRLAPAGARTAHFLSPAVVLARRRHDATRERDEPLDSTPTLEPAPLPCSGVRWGTLTTC